MTSCANTAPIPARCQRLNYFRGISSRENSGKCLQPYKGEGHTDWDSLRVHGVALMLRGFSGTCTLLLRARIHMSRVLETLLRLHRVPVDELHQSPACRATAQLRFSGCRNHANVP